MRAALATRVGRVIIIGSLRMGRGFCGGDASQRAVRSRKALADMLKKDILAIYPQLGDFKIDHAWSGLMGYCVHKMPILKEMEPGLWAATGTGGHGLNATATIGVVAAEGITGKSDRYRLFEPFTAQWGGGPYWSDCHAIGLLGGSKLAGSVGREARIEVRARWRS